MKKQKTRIKKVKVEQHNKPLQMKLVSELSNDEMIHLMEQRVDAAEHNVASSFVLELLFRGWRVSEIAKIFNCVPCDLERIFDEIVNWDAQEGPCFDWKGPKIDPNTKWFNKDVLKDIRQYMSRANKKKKKAA